MPMAESASPGASHAWIRMVMMFFLVVMRICLEGIPQ
jgi:hypothetical protein